MPPNQCIEHFEQFIQQNNITFSNEINYGLYNC
jgi:hypothetical protein